MSFKILVDADSMMPAMRAIILRRAVKANIETVFASDRLLKDVEETIKDHTVQLRAPLRQVLDRSEIRKVRSSIRMALVPQGKDSADDYIISLADENSLVISHDIPLLARAIEKGAAAIDDRGNVYTKENIRTRLSERDVNGILREMQLFDEKTKRFDARTVEKFANAFDSMITSLSVQK